MLTETLRITGIALSAGLFGWLLRAAPLLASVVASLPAWSRFDPLPILAKNKDEEELAVDLDEAKDKETAAERLFSGRSSA